MILPQSFADLVVSLCSRQVLCLRVHYRDMAFMGLAELFSNLNKVTKYTRICKEDILAYKPDVIILIDYGGFNLGDRQIRKEAWIQSLLLHSSKVLGLVSESCAVAKAICRSSFCDSSI